MISINILFPSEKKRIKREVSRAVEEKYNRGVKSIRFRHVGDERIHMHVFLEDGTPLYASAQIYRKIICNLTISEDMSY